MITIVVGAQYGGEGKGKIAAYIAREEGVSVACRCGGPNSSHTVVDNGKTVKLRMMPTAALVNPYVTVVFGAGTLIHIATLLEEVRSIGFSGRLLIDRNAGIITDEIVNLQRLDARYGKIGSTLTGTGLATAYRSQRKLQLASEFPELRRWCCDTFPFLTSAINGKKNILIEGHQGYGLSNFHGDYPYTSSRDSTASEMLSELGLGPRIPGLRIVLATKVFPTRNHAGSVGDELSVKEADAMGITEYGGGSWDIPNRRRRVGVIDFDLVARASAANTATHIALTGADYLDRNVRDVRRLENLTPKVLDFVDAIKQATGRPVKYLSTGPETDSLIVIEGGKREAKRDDLPLFR